MELEEQQKVSVECRGRVTLVSIQRPAVRNAVDRETADVVPHRLDQRRIGLIVVVECGGDLRVQTELVLHTGHR